MNRNATKKCLVWIKNGWWLHVNTTTGLSIPLINFLQDFPIRKIRKSPSVDLEFQRSRWRSFTFFFISWHIFNGNNSILRLVSQKQYYKGNNYYDNTEFGGKEDENNLQIFWKFEVKLFRRKLNLGTCAKIQGYQLKICKKSHKQNFLY